MSEYTQPIVKDLGSVHAMTANDGNPVFVDVPQGTPVLGQPIVGSNPTPGPMS